MFFAALLTKIHCHTIGESCIQDPSRCSKRRRFARTLFIKALDDFYRQFSQKKKSLNSVRFRPKIGEKE